MQRQRTDKETSLQDIFVRITDRLYNILCIHYSFLKELITLVHDFVFLLACLALYYNHYKCIFIMARKKNNSRSIALVAQY